MKENMKFPTTLPQKNCIIYFCSFQRTGVSARSIWKMVAEKNKSREEDEAQENSERDGEEYGEDDETSGENEHDSKYQSLIDTCDRLNKVIASIEKGMMTHEEIEEVEEEIEEGNDFTILKKSDYGKKIKKIKKDRIKMRKQKRLDSCVIKHLGSSDVVKERSYGPDKVKRVFTFKCPECKEEIEINLARHLVTKHKYEAKEAAMKQSELRVLYLWAKGEKTGKQLPLPCELCMKWHLRLDHHLNKKHKMRKCERKKMLDTLRKKVWNTNSVENYKRVNNSSKVGNGTNDNKRAETELQNNSETDDEDGNSETDDEDTFLRRAKNTSKDYVQKCGVRYVPEGSSLISADQRKDWCLEDDDFFHITYKNKKLLMKAFKRDLCQRGYENNAAKQHIQQLELIWGVLDKKFEMFPKNALSNKYVFQDVYHRPAVADIGKGGVAASTLRSRYTSLGFFISFLRKRGVFAGLHRKHLTALQENIHDLNKELGPMIQQRKVDVRQQKKKNLMTPDHMIRYGRSRHVQGLIKVFRSFSNTSKVSLRCATDARDYLMVEIALMNGLRASNLIQLHLKDAENAYGHKDYPGQMVIENSKYKTSSIYGEKLIVLPQALYQQLQKYIKYCRPLFTIGKKSSRLFLPTSDSCKLNQSNVSSSLSSSFQKARIFTNREYSRVCCTRIRVACATFACNEGGIDMGYLAKHFMKNREQTTAIHYNMFVSHRDALCLASLIGDSFQIYNGETVRIKDKEREELTSIMTGNKSLPSAGQVVSWMKQHDNNITPGEIKRARELLSELEDMTSENLERNTKRFYGDIVSDCSFFGHISRNHRSRKQEQFCIKCQSIMKINKNN